MTLRAEGVTIGYGRGEPVVAGASCEVVPGVVTGLFGPNGSGKSTLVRCLSGSLVPQAGRVLLGGRPLAGLSRREVAREVAVVAQETPPDVPLTVREVVLLGRYAHQGPWDGESAEDRRIAGECLRRLGIEGLAERAFGQLSGGERQRAVIARALAQRPRVLLLDEPDTHLDLAHQLELFRLVRALAAEGVAVLMICHDLLLAPLAVDRAMLLDRGRVVASGACAEVLTARALAEVFGVAAEIAWPGPGYVQARLPG